MVKNQAAITFHQPSGIGEGVPALAKSSGAAA